MPRFVPELKLHKMRHFNVGMMTFLYMACTFQNEGELGFYKNFVIAGVSSWQPTEESLMHCTICTVPDFAGCQLRGELFVKL